jgi:hypothetical protein
VTKVTGLANFYRTCHALPAGSPLEIKVDIMMKSADEKTVALAASIVLAGGTRKSTPFVLPAHRPTSVQRHIDFF